MLVVAIIKSKTKIQFHYYLWSYLNVHCLPYFPELNTTTNTGTCKYHPWSIIIKKIQENNQLAKEVHNHWFCRQPFHGLVFIPKLNIYKENQIYSSSNQLQTSCNFLRRPNAHNYSYHSWMPGSQIVNALLRQSWSAPKGTDFLPRKLSGKSVINHNMSNT